MLVIHVRVHSTQPNNVLLAGAADVRGVKGRDVTFHGTISHGNLATEPQSGGAAGGLVAWQHCTSTLMHRRSRRQQRLSLEGQHGNKQ